jgi:predicted CoA-binding protein
MLERDQVEAFLCARRIAFLGLSTSSRDVSRVVFRALVAGGHVVVPIRPGVLEIESARAYGRVRDVPGVIDGALIMMSRRVSRLGYRAALRRFVRG